MAGPTIIKRYPATKGGAPPTRRSAGAGDDTPPSKRQASGDESDSVSPPDTDGSQPDQHSAGDSGGNVSVASAVQQTKDASSGTPRVYESPLKRVRRAIEQEGNKRVIDTACDLKAFAAAEDPLGRGVPTSVSATIALRMRVVWTSFESCPSGVVARLHLTDNCLSNSVEEMHGVFKEGYDKRKIIVDTELVTASLYGVDETAAGLPDDGKTIYISKVWSLKLFGGHSCQLSTSTDSIKIET